MVSKCLIFSWSRFPLAWSVEGARDLVRGEGERRAEAGIRSESVGGSGSEVAPRGL